MLTKLGGQVESLTSHFVAALVVSRCLSFAFWLYGYKEIAPLKGGPNIAGYAIITAHSLQLLLCADFMSGKSFAGQAWALLSSGP